MPGDRWRVVTENPYLNTEEEWGDLSPEEAAGRAEDLTGVSADLILSDLDEVDPWKYEDPDTSQETTIHREVSR